MRFLEKFTENAFSPRKWVNQKTTLVPTESASQELSNEWSCQYVLTILNFLGNFCAPPLVTEATITIQS
jgi:hypothetical protein